MKQFEAMDVHLARVNLSHVELEDLEDYLLTLRKCHIPIAIDTEGPQIRTGNIKGGTIAFNIGDIINIHRSIIECDSRNIYLRPFEAIDLMKPGDHIYLGFDSAVLKVEDTSELASRNCIKARGIVPGAISSNKGVHCNNLHYKLPPLSGKDIEAVKIAKKYGIRYFTLSFISHAEQVEHFRSICPEAILYAKIETLKGVQNVASILGRADGILIDRSDLSREVPAQQIPSTQRTLIALARSANKEAFVASHVLEAMAEGVRPTSEETSAVIDAITDGVSGFVLSKETAIGKYPVETVKTLKRLSEMAKGGSMVKW